MGLDLGKPIGTEALEGEGSRSTRVNDVDMWTVFMARRKHWEESTGDKAPQTMLASDPRRSAAKKRRVPVNLVLAYNVLCLQHVLPLISDR